MYKSKITTGQLCSDPNRYLDDLEKDQAIQVLHNDGSIKVVISQEEYLQLLSIRNHLKPVSNPVGPITDRYKEFYDPDLERKFIEEYVERRNKRD